MRTIALAALLSLLALSAGAGSSGGAVEASGAATPASAGAVNAISCGAPGDCVAGGYYGTGSIENGAYTNSGARHAFVLGETNGNWGDPIKVPGTATAYFRDSNPGVQSISCSAAGECAAGGFVLIGPGGHAFVVSETNGSWGKAILVPGLARLSKGRGAEVRSISCAAPGECAAAGGYVDGNGDYQAFVVSERNGSLGKAMAVPGLAKLNKGGMAIVMSISCGAPGECAVGGFYENRHGDDLAFIVSETNGRWGQAIRVPGTATAAYSFVLSVSCTAVGECAAGGSYFGHDREAFVVSETNGSWGEAITVPGTAELDKLGASVSSISCAAAGECAAGGWVDLHDGLDNYRLEAFVVTETNGTWGQAIEVPGMASLDTSGYALVSSVSCPVAGECVAAGVYQSDVSGTRKPFLAGETNSAWGNAVKVPSRKELRLAAAYYPLVSCAAAGECAMGGFINGGAGRRRPYVVSETNGSWGNAIVVR